MLVRGLIRRLACPTDLANSSPWCGIAIIGALSTPGPPGPAGAGRFPKEGIAVVFGNTHTIVPVEHARCRRVCDARRIELLRPGTNHGEGNSSWWHSKARHAQVAR